jgi:hypothetical protein
MHNTHDVLEGCGRGGTLGGSSWTALPADAAVQYRWVQLAEGEVSGGIMVRCSGSDATWSALSCPSFATGSGAPGCAP